MFKNSKEGLESLRRRRLTEWYWSVEGGKLNRMNPLSYLTCVPGNVLNKSIQLLTPHQFYTSDVGPIE
jgi:hypothetical protein